MSRTESVYFDLCRICAALTVLVGHVVLQWPGSLPTKDYGHYAVDAFFVLSGFVISYVADTKERDARSYFISRVARIYPVAITAIMITLFCDVVGHKFGNAAIYSNIPHDWPALRSIAALTFSSELWFLSIEPFSDGPYWSLCYEVTYYAIFAAAIYLSGRPRVLVICTLCLIAGPKILAMFPIWLLGALLYRMKGKPPLVIGIPLFLLSIAILIDYVHSTIPGDLASDMHEALGGYFRYFEYAQNFPSDYIVGAIFFWNYWAVRSFDGLVIVPPTVSKSVQGAAAITFSLYLFHRPIMLLLMSLTKPTPGYAILVTAITVAICWLLSLGVEKNKRRWRARLKRWLPEKVEAASIIATV